ncbi:hypothetical protein EM20IM_03125 [Candidatus Methylacidiphilum infernorum]|uniref:Uncharacterized protein n=1 Tax=Candidatus Methylacidiphilum infernorum TaxID=511746 RepID=A0ABX7PWF7_9BACT|nr:hypothetical protein [Candidatus Methylacidiphilum infernorum]QSR87336.1 hypothetical protein EM20IM_03125 [Candidatus Methylacidiphilum infernorum]
MKVLVSGMIAGMSDRAFIQKVVELGRLNGKNIQVYDAVHEFTKGGKKPLERLLGTTDYVFELTREREYEKIGFDIQKNGYKDVIIRLPATIEWNRINRKFKDQRILRDFIGPDVIVTLIEAEWVIKKELESIESQDPFLKALKARQHTIYEILSWMNEEVSLSEDWAKYMNIPHYVLSVNESPDSLYKLVVYPKPWVVYASYSMTHATEEMRKVVNEIIRKLRYYAVVIDPQTVEISQEFDSPLDKEVIYAYTVHRDLHWYVGKVDAVIAIHPYPERPPLSAGMMDELGHARDYMKTRYMIFPKGFSPFTTDSYIEKGHLFETAEEFFDYLENVEKRKKYSDILEL